MQESLDFSALEKVFGKNNQSGFGSTVITGKINPGYDIDSLSLSGYKSFLGEKWEESNKSVWLTSWKNVLKKEGPNNENFIGILKGIPDQQAKISIPLLTELIENAEEGKRAINMIFGRSDVEKTAVFTIGDGDAYSGILVSSVFSTGDYCTLMAMMD